MNKYNETFGIDISKNILDCYGNKQGHLQFKNTEKGLLMFLQKLNVKALVVMEVTGYYHYRLACWQTFFTFISKRISIVLFYIQNSKFIFI